MEHRNHCSASLCWAARFIALFDTFMFFLEESSTPTLTERKHIHLAFLRVRRSELDFLCLCFSAHRAILKSRQTTLGELHWT
jgi:hypothetical protein